MAKKQPDPLDIKVGSKVRALRLERQMSQEKLGDALGLTFQQVQKYEKGTNRISASRLQQVCHILQVPVPFFFEGLPGAPAATGSNERQLSTAEYTDFMATRDGLALAKAFMRIGNVQMRRRILHLVEEIEENQD